MSIASRVKAIIVEKLGVDEDEVTPEASLFNDLGADSLDAVELVMEFEKEFNIAIADNDAEKIGTVNDIFLYLKKVAILGISDEPKNVVNEIPKQNINTEPNFVEKIENAIKQDDWKSVLKLCEEQTSIGKSNDPYVYYHKTKALFNLNNIQEGFRAFEICKELFNNQYGNITNKPMWDKPTIDLYFQICKNDALINEKGKNYFNAVWKYIDCLELTDNVEIKFDLKEKRDQVYQLFISDIENLNFENRKVIMVADEYPFFKTQSILPLVSQNLGKLKFPPNHPKKGELYLGHPFRKNVYFPFENAEFLLFESQVMELTKILGKIGARKIEIEHIKGESSEIIQNIQKNISQDTQNTSSLGVNVKLHSVNLSASQNKQNNSENQSDLEQQSRSNKKISVILNFEKPQTIEKPDANEFIWYSHNEGWQDIVHQRMNNGVIDYSLVISSKSSEVLSEREFENIQNEYNNLIKVGYKNLFFSVKGQIQNNEKTTTQSNEYTKLKKMQATEWKIYVEFEPLSNISEKSAGGQNITSQFTESENNYIDFLEDVLDDGIISEDERKMLDKRMVKLNIKQERAIQIEDFVKSKHSYTENELQYIEILKDCLDDSKISEDERKILNKQKLKLNISDERAFQIENSIQKS